MPVDARPARGSPTCFLVGKGTEKCPTLPRSVSPNSTPYKHAERSDANASHRHSQDAQLHENQQDRCSRPSSFVTGRNGHAIYEVGSAKVWPFAHLTTNYKPVAVAPQQQQKVLQPLLVQECISFLTQCSHRASRKKSWRPEDLDGLVLSALPSSDYD